MKGYVGRPRPLAIGCKTQRKKENFMKSYPVDLGAGIAGLIVKKHDQSRPVHRHEPCYRGEPAETGDRPRFLSMKPLMLSVITRLAGFLKRWSSVMLATKLRNRRWHIKPVRMWSNGVL
jgi:hypothetical protein